VSPTRSRKPGRTSKPVGTVALVAAGPGDRELLTLRAVALLRQAHTVVVDADVQEMVQVHVSIDATVIVAVGDDGVPLEPSARIKHVVEAYRAGKHVVRLMSGDPVLDGSISAEISALRKAKVPFEIAPGVSSLSGVAAYAGFTLTTRTTRDVHVLTDISHPVDWVALADERTTVVVLDGAEDAAAIAKELVKAGRKPSTPMVITRSGTTVEQRSIEATLEDVPAAIKAAKQAGPGMVVVGEVVEQREKMAWFEVKPLFGWRVLVPRTQERSDDLLDRLMRAGAVPQEVRRSR
jgi:Uroporphyrinogen-III methylase